MNISGAVEQDIDASHLGGKIGDVLGFANVQAPGSNFGPGSAESRKQRLVDVSGPDGGSFVCECNGGGATDALPRRSNNCNFSRQSSAHL
jgi:hypothetical protein